VLRAQNLFANPVWLGPARQLCTCAIVAMEPTPNLSQHHVTLLQILIMINEQFQLNMYELRKASVFHKLFYISVHPMMERCRNLLNLHELQFDVPKKLDEFQGISHPSLHKGNANLLCIVPI
jgi:hypothetical protein